MNTMLSENDIAKIQDIVINQLAVNRDQLTPEARLEADLCADSLDMTEIAMAVEEAFGLTVPDEEVETIHTIGDLYKVLAKHLRQTSRQV